MRHFSFLSDTRRAELFCQEPEEFGHGDLDFMATALGATVYCPATRVRLADDIDKLARKGVLSVVVCLEDSVPDDQLLAAEENLVQQLGLYAQRLSRAEVAQVMIFIRVRAVYQMHDLIGRLGPTLSHLSGFVLPKFGSEAAHLSYFELTQRASEVAGRMLYVMPVLETPELIRRRTRHQTLDHIEDMLGLYRDQVLAVRTGATDFSSTFGLRKPADMTVYDIQVVKDVLTDILNTFAVTDGTGFVVTGPVWEYFEPGERVLRSTLRETPFKEHDANQLRVKLISEAMDGLIREVQLDKANGFTGKTVIHPSHVSTVHALSVVSHEEFTDAQEILGEELATGGVAASQYRNKMNESKPHRPWAQRIMMRARAFGVAREETSFVDLISAGMDL